MIDEVQAIALARASMLQRGFDPLRLMIGPAMLSRLRRDAPEMIDHRRSIMLDMPFSQSDDMEGFAVVYDPRGAGA